MSFERWGIWWKAFRFHFTSASFMPAILGGMIAWTTDGQFLPGYFLLVMLGLMLNHMALNMTDDYYDFRHLVDAFALEKENPYTGGSGTLSVGFKSTELMASLLPVSVLVVLYTPIAILVVKTIFAQKGKAIRA